MKNLSIIIPTKEEALCLPNVVEELRAKLGKILHEIIVVDAHSKDDTKKIAEKLGCKTYLQNNQGYGNAVSLGLRLATGDYVCFFDADGSYDPLFLLEASKKMEEVPDLDAVFCTRYHRNAGSDDDTPTRAIGNFFFTFLMRILFSVKLSDALHLYVLVKTSSAKALEIESEGFNWCIEFPIRVHQAKMRYCELPMRERTRLAGHSKVNAIADGMRILFSLIKWRIQFTSEMFKKTPAGS